MEQKIVVTEITRESINIGAINRNPEQIIINQISRSETILNLIIRQVIKITRVNG